ncbi:hypothetical protein BJV74DRAFT_867249 [Russula compacta]|nr:hypothetical protein BJV74DRAFT_867249 [Russula compacta]
MWNIRSMKRSISRWTSLGVSIRATKSSKYSLTPLKEKWKSAGRTARVGGGRLIRSGRDRGDWNLMERYSRLGNVARQVAIASGEMYPAIGIS